MTLVGPSVSLGELRTALRASRVLILSVLKTQSHPTPHNSSQYSNAPLIPLASSLQIRLSSNERTRQACRIEVETDTNGRQLKSFTWECEDGETGEIRTIKIPIPTLIVITIRANRARLFSIESHAWTTEKCRTGSRSFRRENPTDRPPK